MDAAGEKPETDERYYDGFEGEDEIFFAAAKDGRVRRRLGVWNGYINDIIRIIEPAPGGWEGITYHYHVTGLDAFSEEKPWRIEDITLVYKQLASVTPDMLSYSKTAEVLREITDLLKEAADNGEEVYLYLY